MALEESRPIRFHRSSNARTAEIPSWIVATAILLPALIFHWPYRWLFIALAIAGFVATDAGMSKVRSHLRIKDAMTPPRHFPDPPESDVARRAGRWMEILCNSAIRPIALFSFGTCVVSVDDNDDPAARARELLQAFGHAIPGTRSGDMLVYVLPDTGDFVIGGHHPSILTFVSRDKSATDASVEQLPMPAAFRGPGGRQFLNRGLTGFCAGYAAAGASSRIGNPHPTSRFR